MDYLDEATCASDYPSSVEEGLPHQSTDTTTSRATSPFAFPKASDRKDVARYFFANEASTDLMPDIGSLDKADCPRLLQIVVPINAWWQVQAIGRNALKSCSAPTLIGLLLVEAYNL